MHLQQYDLGIHYAKGVNNANTDGLSRMPTAMESEAEDIPDPAGSSYICSCLPLLQGQRRAPLDLGAPMH